MAEEIKEGSKVKVHYTGKLDDGTVFDSSEGRDPLQFQIGAKQVIPGFEDAIKGMKKGEEKEIKLEPKNAYGDKNPQMIQKLPKEQLPAEVKPGAMLMMKAPTGQEFPVMVSEVGDKEVTLDLNHPLAGKTLNFKLKLEDVEDGKLEPVAEGYGCSCCDGHDEDCDDEKCDDEACGDKKEDKPEEKSEEKPEDKSEEKSE